MKRVYFIKPVGMDGPVKIGTSCSPDGRRKTLATWSPFPLEIVAEIEGGRDLERRFHVKFYPDCQGREWFKASDELTRVIEAINAGTFDVSELPSGDEVLRNRSARDLSFVTPAFRYQKSVTARIRNIEGACLSDERFTRILGVECHWRAKPEAYLANKDKLEALIEELRAAA